MDKIIKKPKILIYDEDNIKYITGYYGQVEFSTQPMSFLEVTKIEEEHPSYLPTYNTEFTCSISNYEKLDNIELDETTMKRIAKYNKEQECKRLDEKIKEKKEKIKELDNYLKDKEKRVEKLKKYIINIFDIDINDEDDDYWED